MINLRYLIIYITLFGMELSWLYAVLNALNKVVADVLSIPLLLITLLISFVVSRAFRYLRWPRFVLTFLAWVVWPVIMLLMLKIQLFSSLSFTDPSWLMSIPQAFAHIFSAFEPALLVLLSTAALWWLGRRLAFVQASFDEAVLEFQFGFIILVLTIFFCYELNFDQSSSILVSLSFFALGLIGISLSHAENNTWFNSGKRGQWMGILIMSIGLVLSLGFLISVLVTPNLLQMVLDVLKWIWGLIEKIMAFIASLFPQQTDIPSPAPSDMPMGEPQDTGFNLPEWLEPGLKLGYTILMVAFVVFVLYRITSEIFKWMRRQASRAGGEIESLRGAFKADLINWLKRILTKIFKIKFGSRNKDQFSKIPEGIASVRQLYARLLLWGAKKGLSKPNNQTPLEYGDVLKNVLPEDRSELDYITQQYMAARYGCELPKQEELNFLKQTWDKLKTARFKQ